jgi:general secretion pathway protein N
MARPLPFSRSGASRATAGAGSSPAAARRSARQAREQAAGWAAAGRASRRWAAVGAAIGTVLALLAFAPASWLAGAVARATGERLQLADARGTVWQGNAVLVLSAGPGSRDARALPGRIDWRVRPQLDLDGLGLQLGLRHDCCLNGQTVVRLQPGWGRLRATVETTPAAGGAADASWLGQWPAAWLVGLGTPWNTLQPGGALRLSTDRLALDWVAGRFAVTGRAALELRDFSSRITVLPRLGSYRVDLSGDAAQAGTAQIGLSTLDGALQLSGTGSWGATGLRLRGEARAAEADQAALDNLLNIIGRRDGARSLLTIG